MLWIDGVQVGASDVDVGAARLFADHGLRASTGGRLWDGSLASRVVPLGGAYLELVAEAGSGPGWSVSTDDLAGHAERLGADPKPVTWSTPAGGVVRSEAIVPVDARLGLPAIVGWPREGTVDHPAGWTAAHATVPLGVRGLDVTVERSALLEWLGRSVRDLPLRHLTPEPGDRPRVTAVHVALPIGQLVIDLGGRHAHRYAR